MTTPSAIMDRKLADLYTEEADLMYRLAVVRKQIESLSYRAFDAWDAERMMGEGEP